MSRPTTLKAAGAVYPALRWLKRLAALAMAAQLAVYASEAYTRKMQVASCGWQADRQLVDPSYASPPYSVRYCYLNSATILLQVRDPAGKKLLAERMFNHPSFEQLTLAWRLDEGRRVTGLVYGFDDGDHITLPPTLIDRLRARLL